MGSQPSFFHAGSELFDACPAWERPTASLGLSVQGCFGQGGPSSSKKTLPPIGDWWKNTLAPQTGQLALGIVKLSYVVKVGACPSDAYSVLDRLPLPYFRHQPHVQSS